MKHIVLITMVLVIMLVQPRKNECDAVDEIYKYCLIKVNYSRY